MASLNKAILIGNLGRDPEVRHTTNGKAVANFSIATSETWKDKNTGQKQEKTEWHNLIAFDKLAEIVSQYVKKGSQIYVEGKLQTRKWQDKNGQDRYTTEIVVSELKMLGGKREEKSEESPSYQAQKPVVAPGDGFEDPDIPF